MIKFSIKSLIEEDHDPVKPKPLHSDKTGPAPSVAASASGLDLSHQAMMMQQSTQLQVHQQQYFNSILSSLNPRGHPLANYNMFLARLHQQQQQQQQQSQNNQKMFDWLLYQTLASQQQQQQQQSCPKINENLGNILFLNRLNHQQTTQ